MGYEFINQTKRKKVGGGAKTLVSGSSKRKTSFLPHTIEDKLKIAAKNVSKFIDKITD